MMMMALLLTVPTMGQRLKYALVKDEGGVTNVRKGPGTQYAIVEKVKDGSFILYSGNYDDKWKAVYTQQGKLRGYISGSKLEPLESPRF